MAMNRSSSEWLFEKFLEEASAMPEENVLQRRGEDDVVEIQKLEVMNHGKDPGEYAALLKEKLDMYCAVVAMARGPCPQPEDSPTLAMSRSRSLDAPKLGSQSSVRGNSSEVQYKAGGGLGGVLAAPIMQHSVVQGKTTNSESSREQSDDDELEAEMELTENMDPADAKRVRRMLSNRESARRSRRRKEAHLSGLEGQVSQLRAENSSLLKRLTDANQKYSEAAVDNRVLKADVETLRAKVKMAEDAMKSVSGASSKFSAMSDLSSVSIPFTASPSEVTSDAAVTLQGHASHFFQAPAQDRITNTCLLEIYPEAQQPEDATVHGTMSGGKRGRTPSVHRVASLEHLQKRMCGGPGQWDAATGWEHDTSNKAQSHE